MPGGVHCGASGSLSIMMFNQGAKADESRLISQHQESN